MGTFLRILPGGEAGLTAGLGCGVPLPREHVGVLIHRTHPKDFKAR
jgi:hypothetical protein